MTRTPLPGDGCFQASYPNRAWQRVPCAAPRNVPFPPRARQMAGPGIPAGTGARLGTESASPQSVGNGTDLLAALANTTSATGDFVTASNITSETDSTTGNANAFSLQINTNTFSGSPACSGHASCTAWQQYVFETNPSGAWIYMQYWLIRYNAACPAGWNTFSVGTDTYCWKNSSTPSVTQQTAQALGQLKLSGSAGTQDVSSIFTGNNTVTATGAGSVLSLAGNWNQSEFNVVGDGNGGQAIFNAGVTMNVKLNVNNGGTAAPTCIGGGTTGETNNLNLVANSCCTIGGASPAIVFTQTNTGIAYKPYCPQMSYVPTLALLR